MPTAPTNPALPANQETGGEAPRANKAHRERSEGCRPIPDEGIDTHSPPPERVGRLELDGAVGNGCDDDHLTPCQEQQDGSGVGPCGQAKRHRGYGEKERGPVQVRAPRNVSAVQPKPRWPESEPRLRQRRDEDVVVRGEPPQNGEHD